MMNRQKLIHIMRAIATITDEKNFVLVGSASVLLTSKNIPLDMLHTNEIDVYSPDVEDEDLFSDLIEGSIGKGSHFETTFGYYGDGVSSKTATMPTDWHTRAKTVDNLGLKGVTVTVPEINDIALAKMFAWRDKDQEWLRAGVRSKILNPVFMRERLSRLPETTTARSELERRMQSVFAYGGLT